MKSYRDTIEILDRLYKDEATQDDAKYLRETYNIETNTTGNEKYSPEIQYNFSSNINNIVQDMIPNTDDQKMRKLFEDFFKEYILKKYRLKLEDDISKTLLDENSDILKLKNKDDDIPLLKNMILMDDYQIKVGEIKNFFTPEIDSSYDDMTIKFSQNVILGDMDDGSTGFMSLSRSSIDSIEEPQQKKWGKLLLGIEATAISVTIVGGVVYLFLKSKSLSKTQVEKDINQQIEKNSKEKSGCFLVDKSNGKSFKINLLSCTTDSNDNSLQTCSVSDKDCTNKFNPCLRDPSNPIPSGCKRLVVSFLSDRKGVSEYLACSKETCSKYCKIENFNYDQNRYDMECRDVDSNILKLEFVSLVTGVPVSTLLDRLLRSGRNPKRVIIAIIWFINLILLLMIVYKNIIFF